MELGRAICGILSAGTAVLLSACGGGSGDTSRPSQNVAQTNAAPTAVPGPPQAVEAGATVSLNGSASSDPNNDSLSFAWTIASKPAGSSAALSNPASATPTFVADVAGSYIASLTVSDGRLASPPSNVAVTAIVPNQAPLANAGSPQDVLAGSVVTLNGSGSADPNGDALSHFWTMASRPSGSSAALNQPTSATPTFLADLVGTYVVALTVSDGKLSSAPTSVVVVATAVGGGGSPVRKLSGKVIDGYVIGATVFADFNYNGVLDEGEPSTVSTAGGNYELSLTAEQEQCAAYAPLVVNVPVGAIDEQLGAVKEAYQMVKPPKMTVLNLDEAQNLSPLTSLIWSVVGPQIVEQSLGTATCSSFLANQEKIRQTADLVSSAINTVIRTYGVTESQLYEDYVASLNTTSSSIASGTVPVLSKSLAETLSLRQKYPNAKHVRVSYVKGSTLDNNGAYPDAWYRQIYIFDPQVTYSSTVKVTSDLSTDIRTIILGERRSYLRESGTVAQSLEFESRNGDDSPYRCDSKELFSTKVASKSYEIVNLVNKSATKFEDCAVSSFATEAYGRYVFVDNVQYIFTKRPFSGLNSWFDFLDSLSALSLSEFTSYADGLALDASCIALSSTAKKCD